MSSAPLFGEGHSTRDYIYIDAFIYARARVEKVNGQHYYLSTETGHSVKEAFTLAVTQATAARVRKVDCANLREVEKLEPVDFYVRYHKGVQQRFKVDQEILDKILASLAVKLLSLAQDTVGGKEYCHILVRTRHSNGDKQISALDLVSLIKIKDTWKVTLNAQQPVVKKVESPPK